MRTIGFTPHDHRACIASGLAAVERACRDEGLRLTPARRRVMEILLAGHRARGAYDILEQLRAAGMSAQPPVAYRALDFLTRHGFAHRIERLNAFVACACPGRSHAPVFLICRRCDAVAETMAAPVQDRLDRAAEAEGFAVESASLEAEGLCPACREDRP
jgi:Fur family zinc uptake transcriptional regulator